MNEIIFNIFKTIISIFVILTLVKNYIFLIISPYYPVKENMRYIRSKLNKGRSIYNPMVSIIVPAWNEEVGIIKTIESIAHNGYNNYEIMVVNDGSTDNSDEKIKSYLSSVREKDIKRFERINYIYQKNGGKGSALNNGIKNSHGEIILTIDADSALKHGAIANLVKYYLDEKIMAVVGNVKVVNTTNIIGLAQQLEYYFGFYNKRGHAVLGAEYIFGGACASFRKEIFDKIGYFDTKNKTEDIEMSMRTRFHGYECTYAEDVICYTEGALTLQGLVNQRIRWKKGRFDTFSKYRSMFFSTEDSHNFFLSFFILPFSLLAEIQLFFEPIAIAILVTYSIITGEFLSLAIGILFILMVYISTSLFSNDKPRPEMILLFPFTWPLFYFLDWIEFIALCQSINMIKKGKDVEWQTWQRQGIAKHIKTQERL